MLVLATGFRVDRFLRPIEVTGRGGVSLDEVWAKRPSAYLGMSIPQFPNLFLLNGPNGPVGNFSLIEVAELQVNYLLPLIELLRTGEYAEIAATAAGRGALRGRARRGRQAHRVGDGVSQLVPRRPWHPRRLALDLRPLPRGHGPRRPRDFELVQ